KARRPDRPHTAGLTDLRGGVAAAELKRLQGGREGVVRFHLRGGVAAAELKPQRRRQDPELPRGSPRRRRRGRIKASAARGRAPARPAHLRGGVAAAELKPERAVVPDAGVVDLRGGVAAAELKRLSRAEVSRAEVGSPRRRRRGRIKAR